MTELEVIIGDSEIELRKMPTSRKYRCIVTSPPYNLGKPYKGYSDNKIEDAYQIKLRNIFAECYRLMSEDGLLFINLADEAANWFRAHDVLKILTNSINFKFVHRVVWSKPTVQVLAKGKQIGFSHEFIFILAKSEDYKLRYYLTKDVWEFYAKKPDWMSHPAVFPVELPLRCARLACEDGDGSWLLDPFGGTATVMRAARDMNLNCTIVEYSKEYIPEIKRNIYWGSSLYGNEHFKLFQDGELKEEILMPELEPDVLVSWSDKTDKESLELRIGLEKYV